MTLAMITSALMMYMKGSWPHVKITLIFPTPPLNLNNKSYREDVAFLKFHFSYTSVALHVSEDGL
jgi:hypothetical protein